MPAVLPTFATLAREQPYHLYMSKGYRTVSMPR